MKVRQLLEALQGLDPELDVLLAVDEDGNSFNFLDGVDEAFIDPTEQDYGSLEFVYLAEDADEYDAEDGYPADFKRVAVLWP